MSTGSGRIHWQIHWQLPPGGRRYDAAELADHLGDYRCTDLRPRVVAHPTGRRCGRLVT